MKILIFHYNIFLLMRIPGFISDNIREASTITNDIKVILQSL